jgi:hypothetical protein
MVLGSISVMDVTSGRMMLAVPERRCSFVRRRTDRDSLLNPSELLAMQDRKEDKKEEGVVCLSVVSTLHILLSEMGEEYLLLLLFECTPFLSELMEDEAVTATKDTLRRLGRSLVRSLGGD